MRLKRTDGMNVVPFIDVMLVLLAIVLTISTFIAQGKIKIDLPTATTNEQQKDRKDPFEITIDKDNILYIKEEVVTLEVLKDRLASVGNKDEVFVYGDSKSNFGSFIDVVDLLKAKGHENFQIVTKHEK
ncbi:MAG: TonB system transport protein ExbD [Campylobacteraceae bacterium]